jgi:Ca-activated chloride channel family protein
MVAVSAARAQAQDATPETSILVLDASGSMWGQLEGEAKIVIARRVIGDLLDRLPQNQSLGLMAYGHNRKGDCADIEMLVEPGPDSRAAIAEAVNGLNPVGMTPLSDAVIQAAEALKYEENVATVILVSDGRETCEMDPCAVGEQLEQTGVGFTAHVIGFDVAEEEDRRQLQCLAENTGGKFLTASNASELSEALETVSTAPEPEPEPQRVDVVFEAIAGEGGPVITRGLVWTLANSDTGETVLDGFDVATVNMALEPGNYMVSVERAEDGARAEQAVAVEGESPQRHTLVLESTLPDATVSGPQSAAAGSTIPVQWTGPDSDRDYISVAAPDDGGGGYANYTYTRNGSPLKLLMPPDPGEYELRYILNEGNEILARQPISVTPVSATVSAPEAAAAGSTIAVEWEGPDYDRDYISVAVPDDGGGGYVNYTYTRNGSPLELVMPPEPGEYEIRYIQTQGNRVLARKAITVEEVVASVSAPESAAAGSTVAVEWTGPDYDRDYISVAVPDDGGGGYVNYTYTRNGSPLELVMPPEPGEYEIRYVQTQDNKVLARKTITVREVEAAIAAPDSAAAGSTVTVEWQGPDYDRDYISVAVPDDGGGGYVNYTYTRNGSPLQLLMPPDPGEYEIRYIQTQGNKIMARKTISVEPVEASIAAPDSAVAGSTVAVEWQGPDYDRDYISVAVPDDGGGGYVNYSYTRNGSPLQLLMPPEPGEYEIRYIQTQGNIVLARKTISLQEVEASVSAPSGAAPGETVVVEWEGPDYERDYISVASPDDGGGGYVNYTYTRNGSPLELVMPEEPGTYEVRYIMTQNNRIIARTTVEVE